MIGYTLNVFFHRRVIKIKILLSYNSTIYVKKNNAIFQRYLMICKNVFQNMMLLALPYINLFIFIIIFGKLFLFNLHLQHEELKFLIYFLPSFYTPFFILCYLIV